MDLILIGGGILLLYWLGTPGAQASGAPGPGQISSVSSATTQMTPAGGIIQDIGQVVGQVSTVAKIGQTVASPSSPFSTAVQSLLSPSAPSPPTPEFSLFTQGPLPQEILPVDLVDATEFIPSAEQAISAGAEILIPGAFEFFGSISEGAGGALSLSQVAGEVPILWTGAPVLATAAEEVGLAAMIGVLPSLAIAGAMAAPVLILILRELLAEAEPEEQMFAGAAGLMAHPEIRELALSRLPTWTAQIRSDPAAFVGYPGGGSNPGVPGARDVTLLPEGQEWLQTPEPMRNFVVIEGLRQVDDPRVQAWVTASGDWYARYFASQQAAFTAWSFAEPSPWSH